MPASPGDPLRISATDWNAVKTMLRSWKATQGEATAARGLPCLRANLRAFSASVRRPRWGEAVSLFDTQSSLVPIDATIPFQDGWTPSEDELTMLALERPQYSLLHPVPWTTRQTADLHQPFAICVDKRNMTFAISGMALVRVRFLSRWHRYVRRPILLPTDDPETDGPNLVGCLDSAGSGPGYIVGVLGGASSGKAQAIDGYPWGFLDSAHPTRVVWALIRW